jgi:hypothetical protein
MTHSVTTNPNYPPCTQQVAAGSGTLVSVAALSFPNTNPGGPLDLTLADAEGNVFTTIKGTGTITLNHAFTNGISVVSRSTSAYVLTFA